MGKSGGGEWRCSTDQCFRMERKTNWNHTHFSEVLNMFEMSSLFNTFGIETDAKQTVHLGFRCLLRCDLAITNKNCINLTSIECIGSKLHGFQM